MKALIIYLILIVAAVQVATSFAQTMKEDYALYLSESACVRGMVSMGIERSNIITFDGTCSNKKVVVLRSIGR